MDVPIKEIWLKSEERLRVEYGDLKSLAQEFNLDGQLQDILIREPYEFETPPDGKRWVIIDGGRRYLARLLCMQAGLEIPYLEEGMIGAKVRAKEEELKTLQIEFRANEERKSFTWRERAEFVHRIHEGHIKKNGDEWSVEHTAAVLRMSDKTVYKYLAFYDDPEAFTSEKVQNADTFNTAYKQFQIVKEMLKRERLVAHREERLTARAREVQTEADRGYEAEPGGVIASRPDETYVIPSEFAQLVCQVGDCREWLPQIPNDSFDWFHWDPPWGGEQSGGAFTQFNRIDDSWIYAEGLMKEMIPHIWRTLRDGRWIALWYHPKYYKEVVTMLQGHEVDWQAVEDEGIIQCAHCQQEWFGPHIDGPCMASPTPFWVNTYPNLWYKADRKSAGQEIRRFLVNAHEDFLFACALKSDETQIILPKTDRQNIFTYIGVSREERRHVMHKPVELLTKILECISIAGEFGCDPSAGSFSIVEAALLNHRKIVACEIDRQARNGAVEAIEKCVTENGLEPYPVDFAQ